MTEEQKADRPPNSMRSKKERTGTPEADKPKRVEKIVEGTVAVRKKGAISRIVSAFAADDKESILDSITMDILVPAAKNMVFDAISEVGDAIRMGFERAIFGDRLPRSRYDRPAGYTTTGSGYINYSRIRQSPVTREYGTMTPRARARHDFNDLVFVSRGEAMDVLDELQRNLSEYGIVTVEDLYRMAGITPDFTDAKYGWEDLRGSAVRHTRGGYMIAFPRPRPID